MCLLILISFIMFSYSVFTILIMFCASYTIIATKVVEGSQPVLQRTVEALFKERSEVSYPGTCKLIRSSVRQTKMCQQDTSMTKVLRVAKEQAINACEEAFQYDRWNCSLVFNRKMKRSIFNKIYRETAFVYALMAASMTHAVAKACAAGELARCSCSRTFHKNATPQWKGSGCGDDFRYGKKFTRNFLDFRHAGADQIGEILKQDVTIGMNSIGEQMREVCKCHGFSGSCTTKTCWKRLGPFPSAMGILKKHYHHAVKRKIVNFTTKRAVDPKVRKKLKLDKNNLVYLQKTPNLCVSTHGRVCRDRDNCATLCCGRGFTAAKKPVSTRCRCRMESCCFVRCDTCIQLRDEYTCK